jgi:DNA-binding transcriptional regulator GbsR (MarR family)
MEKLKRLLLECELALKERQIDTALEKLQKLSELSLEGLKREELEEVLRLVEHLITLAEDYRNALAQSLINLRKFKGA